MRGGTPTAADRVLATRRGRAIDTLAAGTHGVLVGIVRNDIVTTPLADITAHARCGREPARARARDGDLELQELHQGARAGGVRGVRRDAGREMSDLLHRGRERADDVDSGHRLELTKLLHAELRFPRGDR